MARKRATAARRSKEAPKKSAKSSNRIIRYFQETQEELRKVTWPTREETIRLTMIVLGATVIFAVFLGALDFIFQRLAGFLL